MFGIGPSQSFLTNFGTQQQLGQPQQQQMQSMMNPSFNSMDFIRKFLQQMNQSGMQNQGMQQPQSMQPQQQQMGLRYPNQIGGHQIFT